MVKLHLGCGSKHIDGYVNIDIRYLPGVDEINNVKFLRNYKNNSVDEIYCCHTLEHFTRWEYKQVLQRWFDILKPGGIVRLSVPNFKSICEYYNKTNDLKSLMGLLYGGQDYDENFHYVTFDFDSLNYDFNEIGFTETGLWDNKIIPIDDFSKCYLPHMDSENGLLMSLNFYGIK